MALIKRDAQRVSKSADGYAELRTVHHRSNGSAMLSMIDVQFNELGGAPAHACTNTEEIVYVLEGWFDVYYDGTRGELNKGDCICYPEGMARSYWCDDLNPGRLLFISPHPEPHWLRKSDQSVENGSDEAKREFEGHVRKASDWEHHLKGVKRRTFCSPEIGALSTFASDIIIKPGGTIPIHYHPVDDVSLYCLEGEVLFAYGTETLKASAGDALLVEAGMVHGVANRSSADARFLEIYPTGEPEYVYIDQDGLDKSNFLQLEPEKAKQIREYQRQIRGGS